MKKIIYIAGLGHSGSTILDMSLGMHSRILGLGELTAYILKTKIEDFKQKEFNQILCSCGGDLNSCIFWKEAKQILIKEHQAPLSDKYDQIINLCAEKHNKSIIVDSSKSVYDHLKTIDARYDLRVIFLIRDCRGWCYSRHSRHGTSMVKLAYTWLIDNLKIKKFLINNNITFKQFGYEEIAFFPEIMLKKICEFADIKFEKTMLEPGDTKSHIIRGNIARCDEYKKKGFMYDGRWLTSNKLNIITPLLLPAILWNNNNVYKNFITGPSNSFGVKQNDFLIFGNPRKEDIIENISKV